METIGIRVPTRQIRKFFTSGEQLALALSFSSVNQSCKWHPHCCTDVTNRMSPLRTFSLCKKVSTVIVCLSFIYSVSF
jgi:hypothetical protein